MHLDQNWMSGVRGVSVKMRKETMNRKLGGNKLGIEILCITFVLAGAGLPLRPRPDIAAVAGVMSRLAYKMAELTHRHLMHTHRK